MRNRASGTSQITTLVRALADGGLTEVPGFVDPTALPMLPARWRGAARLLRRCFAARPGLARRMFERSDGKLDLIALRTRMLDDAWHAARERGVRQLVLLGAGLDGRAFRLDDLGGSSVFEVDHPATQALKRELTAGMASHAARHAYVPTDFEHESLETALEAAGHRADLPTCWLWEGVTQYLTGQAQDATLAAVGRRSAPGSRLALTYVVPRTRAPGPVLRIVGEPWIGFLSPAEAAAKLSQAGLRPVEDSGQREWRERIGGMPRRQGEVGERIAIGER